MITLIVTIVTLTFPGVEKRAYIPTITFIKTYQMTWRASPFALIASSSFDNRNMGIL